MSEEGQRTGDWLDTPGSGSEPGAGVTSSPTPRTTSPSSPSSSSSGEHQDKVTVTPPRHEPFVFDPHRRRLYSVLNETTADILREVSDVRNIDEGLPVTNPVPETDMRDTEMQRLDNASDDNANKDETDAENTKKRKTRGPNKMRQQMEEIKARKEEKISRYEVAKQAYLENKFTSFRACAKHYGLNDKTLKKLVESGNSFVGRGSYKSNLVLTSEEEARIVEHIRWCKSVGYGLRYYDLQILIQELLTEVVRLVGQRNGLYKMFFSLFSVQILREAKILNGRTSFHPTTLSTICVSDTDSL